MAGKAGQKSTLNTEVSTRYDGDFMSQLDGRAKVARTLRDRLRALTNDLGGIPNLSYQEFSLCKRAVHLERLIEKRELTLSHNGTVDENCYYSAITTLSSLFSKVGYKRRVKPIQSLDEYVKAHYSRTESAPDHEASVQDVTQEVLREDAIP
jgi:hypothetical protein